MRGDLVSLTYEVEIQPGEELTLPEQLKKNVRPGRWLITIQPVILKKTAELIRNHNAFLNSYAMEDEGLYDDYPSR
jgi:hypothetical protein